MPDSPKTTRWPRHKGSMHITHNQHLDYYETVQQALERGTYDRDDFLDDAEVKMAIATGDVWAVHWYPDTPIGSYIVFASTFDRAVEGARKLQEDVDNG